MTERRVNLAQELHDGIAQDLVGLGFSIDSIISTIDDLHTKQSLREVRFTITELINKVRLEIHQIRSSADLLDEATHIDFNYQILRVLSEILRNVSEHSQASQLSIEIADNGIGGASINAESFGLIGIQERIGSLNGEIRIDSSEKGTKISIQVPFER
jgi:signal transduction histidine kinase